MMFDMNQRANSSFVLAKTHRSNRCDPKTAWGQRRFPAVAKDRAAKAEIKRDE
jgi:hypothetical protein